MSAKYDLWVRVLPEGKWPAGSWHVLDTDTGLDKDEADRRELVGNARAKRYGTNTEYRALPTGQKPSERVGA